jgi:hypothetical protein
MELKIDKIDLFADWIEIISEELSNQMFDISGLNQDELSILYFSNRKKIIQPKKRTVHKSDTFSCPSEHLEGLEILEKKIIDGELLRPNQSRMLKNLKDKDGLLFDWGIFHLHLGKDVESDGFIKRTGPLLYVLFDDNNAYFIDVLEHGQWTNQNLLKVIYKNWPQTIESYRIKGEGIIGLEKNCSDEEINQLRRANVNVLIEIEPKVIFIGPGGGVAASGHSMEAIQNHMDNRRELQRLENQIKDNTAEFLLRVFDNLDFIKNPHLKFKMIKNQFSHEINEENNNFSIILNR